MTNIFDFKGVMGIDAAMQGAKIGQVGGRWMAAKIWQSRARKAGYDDKTVEAVGMAAKAGRDPNVIIAEADRIAEIEQRQAQMLAKPPEVHGAARFAQKEDLLKKSLIKSHQGSEISLGSFNNLPLMWDGESHLLTVAPTRTGKSTLQIVPNLLQYKGSALVLDPKGELYQQTADWRRKNVGKVYKINPFDLEGLDGKTDAFNPLDVVTDSLSATKLAEILYPRTNHDNLFFDNEAIAFLAGVVEYFALHKHGEERTLGALRDSLTGVNAKFYDLLDAMRAADMPPSIRNAGESAASKTRDTGQPRLMDSLSQHLRIWDNQGLRRCTNKTDFDFWDLKEMNCTIYLILPFEEIEAYSTFVQMMLASALSAMLEHKKVPEIPVLFILDEFLTLTADDRFVSALRTHASAGVRLWFFLQDLPTLEQKYPTTWKSFFQTECKTFFGTDDPYTAELISKYLCDMTVAYEVPDLSGSLSGGEGASVSQSSAEKLNLAGRKLLTPDEVLTYMAKDGQSRKAIHFVRDVPPIPAALTPWFATPVLKARVNID